MTFVQEDMKSDYNCQPHVVVSESLRAVCIEGACSMNMGKAYLEGWSVHWDYSKGHVMTADEERYIDGWYDSFFSYWFPYDPHGYHLLFNNMDIVK